MTADQAAEPATNDEPVTKDEPVTNDEPTNDDRGSSAPDWLKTAAPAYMPSGAWRPEAPAAMPLEAPASTGWMPPPSSFHALAFGSSLAVAGASPGDAARAAADAAATVAGDAIASAREAVAVDRDVTDGVRDALATGDTSEAAALLDAERTRMLAALTDARESALGNARSAIGIPAEAHGRRSRARRSRRGPPRKRMPRRRREPRASPSPPPGGSPGRTEPCAHTTRRRSVPW